MRFFLLISLLLLLSLQGWGQDSLLFSRLGFNMRWDLNNVITYKVSIAEADADTLCRDYDSFKNRNYPETKYRKIFPYTKNCKFEIIPVKKSIFQCKMTCEDCKTSYKKVPGLVFANWFGYVAEENNCYDYNSGWYSYIYNLVFTPVTNYFEKNWIIDVDSLKEVKTPSLGCELPSIDNNFNFDYGWTISHENLNRNGKYYPDNLELVQVDTTEHDTIAVFSGDLWDSYTGHILTQDSLIDVKGDTTQADLNIKASMSFSLTNHCVLKMEALMCLSVWGDVNVRKRISIIVEKE